MRYTPTLLLVLSFIFSTTVVFPQTVELLPTYNSIGVKISGIGLADSCKIMYRQLDESTWLDAFPPDKITIKGEVQFRGSLFLLEEGTKYVVKGTLYEGGTETVLPLSQTVTKTSPAFTNTSNVKWVSPDGSGTEYSEDSPGDIVALFSSKGVTCGTTVIMKEGVYSLPEKGLSLTFNSSCEEDSPILIKAAPGARL